MNKLPHYDELFTHFFARWYDDASRAMRPYKTTRPDMERIDTPGVSAADASPLLEKGQEIEKKKVAEMTSAALSDWPSIFKVSEPISLRWVQTFDREFNREAILQIIQRSDASKFSNDYMVFCCELGVVIGETLIHLKPDLQWMYDRPYWESAIWDAASGTRINVFHWAIKKMSEAGVEDKVSAKIRTCLQDIKRVALAKQDPQFLR
jgi:hypothetical protein